MSRILIIAPAWVGDTVMAQPMFMRLHERHANLVLDVLAPAWTLPLLKHMPEINEGIPNPFLHGELNLIERYRLGKQLRARDYDQAIILPNSFKSALIPFFAHIPVRTGYSRELRQLLLTDPRKLDEKSLPLMVERFASLATARGAQLHRPLPPPSLRVDANDQKIIAEKFDLSLQQPVTVLCIGAEYGLAKRWPPQYFAKLATHLHQTGHAVWLIGSAKDSAIGAEINLASGNICHDLCGKTSLDEAINLLACAALVVSNDSGLMHVAAALDKPMLALYGSSSPGFTPPLSDKARVVSLNLSCSPCFKRECPLGHFNCMMQLTPERVIAEVAALGIKI